MATKVNKATKANESAITKNQFAALVNEAEKLVGVVPMRDRATAKAMLVAYAMRTMVHADAQKVTQSVFDTKGIATTISGITCWHSAPVANARRLSGNKARYDAANIVLHGLAHNLAMACEQHGLNRVECVNTCLQGLAHVGSIDGITTLVNDKGKAVTKPVFVALESKMFAAIMPKAAKPAKVSKPKAKPVEVPNDEVQSETSNENVS
jgi:hypothetical protein